MSKTFLHYIAGRPRGLRKTGASTCDIRVRVEEVQAAEWKEAGLVGERGRKVAPLAQLMIIASHLIRLARRILN